ncbi:MAG: permease-like cell division protein FtsX [Betaproteobacteria bacterium]|nr:permease-like cell division protein FtsX [Betaproteobacteria bacterium]
MKTWLLQHYAAFSGAVRRLCAAPLNSLLSLLVIGIALTLPAGGWVLLENLRALSNDAHAQQISVFLDAKAGQKEAEAIRQRLNARAPGPWHFVAREDALKRLESDAEMKTLLDSLPGNPLPDAFIVEPLDASPAALETLAGEIRQWPSVAHVQLDSAWIQRLDALMRIGKRAVLLLAGIFAAALVAVTFNTIRLQILAQGAEIEVARLIGATNAWVRRPFYYFGALEGMLGGLFAALLVDIATRLLAQPVNELAILYGGNFSLAPLSSPEIGALALIGATLGWLGAQLSVSLYLYRLE